MQKITYMKYPNKVAENADISIEYLERSKIFKDTMLKEFFELCKIPHPSGHVEKMRQYLYDWGKKHNLPTVLDDSGCVYMDIEATNGCENYPSLIFQSHYDMVAVASKTNTSFVKTETPIVPYYDEKNNCIHTKWETSLGADDGCGVASCLALAILHQDKNFKFEHGPIRLLFTYDEETTMQGVVHLSKEAINAKYLINLDSIYVGMLLSSAAGAISSTITKRIQTINAGSKGYIFTLNIWGLTGGHSGEDIDKNRGSTSIILVDILNRFTEESINFNFQELECGTLMNSIPSKLNLKLIMGSKDIERSKLIAEEIIRAAKGKYVDGKDIKYEMFAEPAFAKPMLSISDSIKITHLLTAMPKSVVSKFENGKPKSSCNVGHVVIENGFFQLDFLFRSINMQEIDRVNDIIKRRCKDFRMDYMVHGRFHAWPKMEINPINQLFLKGYRDICGFEGTEVDIHSGIECGYLYDKYPFLTMSSIGCDIVNEHTRKETLFTKSLPAHFANILYVIEHFNEVENWES